MENVSFLKKSEIDMKFLNFAENDSWKSGLWMTFKPVEKIEDKIFFSSLF